MELPWLKPRGHPDVTPSPKSFCHPEAGGFLLHSEQAAFPPRCFSPAALDELRHSCRESACSLFRRSCASDSAALLVQLRAIVRPGAGRPLCAALGRAAARQPGPILPSL